jgi:predicted Zn-dependent protease with MMP-like domain
MDTVAFEQMVEDALAAIPEPFAQRLDTVQVFVEPEPTFAQRRAVGLRPRDTLFGLYEGVPLPQRLQGLDSGALPSVITIFRRALSSAYPDEDELRAQVRRTVFHEVAHHFGISDERLHELGAY